MSSNFILKRNSMLFGMNLDLNEYETIYCSPLLTHSHSANISFIFVVWHKQVHNSCKFCSRQSWYVHSINQTKKAKTKLV